MFALILDSLGGTELLFILAIALIFFGPRKLPELARSMGKGLAEFRKASDDFKRTWEREVELESTRATENSILNDNNNSDPVESESASLYEPADSELTIARGSSHDAPESETTAENSTPIEPTRKQEWL